MDETTKTEENKNPVYTLEACVPGMPAWDWIPDRPSGDSIEGMKNDCKLAIETCAVECRIVKWGNNGYGRGNKVIYHITADTEDVTMKNVIIIRDTTELEGA